jgi:hypothetical protein
MRWMEPSASAGDPHHLGHGVGGGGREVEDQSGHHRIERLGLKGQRFRPADPELSPLVVNRAVAWAT